MPDAASVARYQQQSFHALLRHVWRSSPFYRDLYSSAGITEQSLADIAPGDLPMISKQLLMDNFDRAVTDPRLKKAELQRWVHEYRNPAAHYRHDFIVLHSSGTSGTKGIFVYTRRDWQIAATAMTSRLPPPVNYPAGRTKVAIYLVCGGNYSGVSVAARMPQNIYETLILSELDSKERIVEQLNAFQPHQLHGYASNIHELSRLAHEGVLRISPGRIFVGGDTLTRSMEESIIRVWSAPVYDIYSTSESTYIAYRQSGESAMSVVDELNILEVLDDAGRRVGHHQQGRAVLTNLYNYALPLIRYELGDVVTLGDRKPHSPSESIANIAGRVTDGLPVTLKDGSRNTLEAHVLAAFYIPGLEKIQFLSLRPDLVRILYVAGDHLDDPIRHEFQRVLELKAGTRTAFEVQRVGAIGNDPRTGKFKLVRFPDEPAVEIELGDRAAPVFNANVAESVSGVYPPTDGAMPPGPGAVPASAAPKPTLLNQRRKVKVFREPPEDEQGEQTIIGRFERQVERFADRLAIQTLTTSWTYDQLNERANRIARAITTSGRTVALLFEHDAMAIAGILGVLKAGKAYVALDPSDPIERLDYFLADSRAEALITNGKNLALAERLSGSIAVLVADEINAAVPAMAPSIASAPDDLAYILYTSGSAGRPKGVCQNQRNVLYFAGVYRDYLQISADDRLTQFPHYTSDAAVVDVFAALLNGAALYLWDARERGVNGVGSWMRENGITLYHSTPSLFATVVESLEPECTASVRAVVLGGEAADRRHVLVYQSRFGNGCRLINLYGASESSISSFHEFSRQGDGDRDFVPIGGAAPKTEVLLLDDAGATDPLFGEIALKSEHLAPGYWHRPELTDRFFSPAPEGGATRIYRTGDIGCYLADGNLEFVGRKDFQLKIRGFLVQPEEIEDALRAHPMVLDAVAIGQRHDSGDLRLIAFIETASDEVPSATDLRAFLAEKLPTYMIPAVFVRRDALPRTPNGKLDRGALPAMDPSSVEPDGAYVPPRTPLEGDLAGLWAGILAVDRIGIHDNFFELGGHSLMAMRVVFGLREVFQIDVPLLALFEHPTVATLAAHVTACRIGERQSASETVDELDQLLRDVETLSEKEATQMLEGDGTPRYSRR
jgi:amino acid adenylation domain-containing protein